ncbi:hypothetical protein [uncultured Flavobacterium sp.]|uniref:hypothetical protein n=1 Tax=uncultured Flavobacterium sp. TaxID=165435 RepID=UPI0030EF911F|tara:strand:+ start:44083 stop:46101 length:2019 start_codon:yes stop_codon:yes gene_type:complete
MALSDITVTFGRDLAFGEIVSFKQNHPMQLGESLISEKFTDTRTNFGEVPIGVPTSTIGERSAINYAQYLNLDYYGFFGANPPYGVFRVGNTVTIRLDLLWSFNVSGITLPSDVTVAIFNYGGPAFNISSQSFSQADTLPCQNIKLNIQTSVLATKILSPFAIDPNTNNPFSIDVLRGSNPITLTLKDANDNNIIELIDVPEILSPNNFQVQINNSPNGATVIVNNTNFSSLVFQYSLDNITWQSSNTFSGQIAGNYTVYIKDEYGCSISIDYIITVFGITEPYFYISKANSLRFANRVDFGDAANYKNDENTLSCEVDVLLPYKETQLFQTADVITTQFKSNYETNEVKVVKEDSSEDNILVTKKSNYIGNKDSKDARKYDLGNGHTAIYFLTGNIYDFNTGLTTGETHYLNGGLPIWAKSGNYVKVDNEWFLIEDILYDESKNAEIIVISSNYSGSDISVIAGTIYNIFDYEIYEFTIDMVDYIDQTIKVRILSSDDNFTTVTQLSEDLNIQVKQENTKSINYWNNDNTDIFYATGIKHSIRIPYHKRSGVAEESSEVHKTDTNSILLSAEIYEVDEFKFEPVTKEIWRKLMIALAHKNVIIDGVGYVKNGEFETEGPLEDTNLYVLTAKMIKTGNVFASQSDGTIDFNTSNSQIPGLISNGNNGYLRYN